MDTDGDLHGVPILDFETWRVLIRSQEGLYSSERVGRDSFEGSIRRSRIYGFDSFDLSCSVSRTDRTLRDARRDGLDHYKAFFQVSGRATLIQNDQVTELAVGDCGFVDVSRPLSIIPEKTPGRWVCLHLPRQSLISHLGLEPSGGLCWRSDTHAVRLLYRLIMDAPNECDHRSAAAEPYMHLAVYDLLGALLAASDLPPNTSHTDKLFTRVCDIIKSQFSNPDIRPRDVAVEAGFSLRYLQKLFTARGTTCSQFIQSRRLDQAARLLHRRAMMKTNQPLSEIAYACGFRDYTHFARTFRHRFGCTPSECEGQVPGNPLVRGITSGSVDIEGLRSAAHDAGCGDAAD